MPEFTRDDFRTFYQEEGDRESPAVVLLHGFTSDHRMWQPIVEGLREDYRVIAPDLRGHGGTSAPPSLDEYTMEIYAEDVRALLDELDVDLCVLVGCSFGGMIAAQFAVNWPERLAGLVLSDTSAAFEHPEYDERYHRREERIAAQTDVVDRFGTAELGKRAAKDVADPFLAEGLRKRFSRLSREGYLGAAKVRRERPNLLPVLRERLTMPVLVCIGEDDPVRSASDVMVREMGNARYVTFRKTGHGVPTLRPNEFGRELVDFFDSLETDEPVTGTRTVG